MLQTLPAVNVVACPAGSIHQQIWPETTRRALSAFAMCADCATETVWPFQEGSSAVSHIAKWPEFLLTYMSYELTNPAGLRACTFCTQLSIPGH